MKSLKKLVMIALLTTAPLAGMAVASRDASAILCWHCISHQCTLNGDAGSLTCAQLNSFPWCQLSGTCIT